MTDQLPNLSFNLDTVENEGAGTRKREKIKEGISCYRILPPYGTNANGSLSHRYTVHWGFMGANGKERSVACSYQTEGYCPVCQRVREAEDEMKRAEANNNEAKKKELEKYISNFRAKKFWLYNAVTSDGRIVMLELGKTAHDALSKKISEAVRRKVGAFDPTSPETGVWFEFSRSGKGLNTEYAVDYKKIAVDLGDGNVADKPDRTPLSPELVEQIKAALAGTAVGMHDIHTAHESTTSTELRALMNGGVVQNRKPLSVGGTQPHASAPATPAAQAPAADASNVQAEINRLKSLQAGS
jgi:hypothetical protein